MEFDSQSSNEDKCLPSDSILIWMSAMKRSWEINISNQEQIDKKTLFYYSHNDQNIIMLLKYTKHGNFRGLKEKPGLSLIILRYSENLQKTTGEAKARPKKDWGWARQIHY